MSYITEGVLLLLIVASFIYTAASVRSLRKEVVIEVIKKPSAQNPVFQDEF